MKGVAVWLVLASSAGAWDTPPHRKMTQAALETLPAKMRSRLGAEAAELAEIYCILPDRYQEMEQFGFTRKSPGPQTSAEIRVYCVRPDGEAIHSASFDHDEDLASLIYLFEGILRSFSEGRNPDAAKYMGTLAHFLEDSLSPPHSVPGPLDVHGVIERSIPEFSLSGRPPRMAGEHILEAVEAILTRCYAAAEQNRKDLPVMVRAAKADDQRTLDTYRLRAGKAAAELVADAFYTLLEMASQ